MKRSEAVIEVLKVCPNCGGRDIKPFGTAKDIFYKITEQDFTFSNCGTCGLFFLSVRPDQSSIGAFYPDAYGPYNNAADAGAVKKTQPLSRILIAPVVLLNRIISRIFLPAYERKLARVASPPADADVILDFGCGDDSFLNQYRDRRVTIGMDFTDSVVEKVKKSGHKGVLYNDESAWDSIPDNSVAFVRMNHVVEHLYDPEKVFKMLHKKMKTNGLLHIAVPNPRGISARQYKKYALAFADVPRHIMMHPEPLLKTILEKNGFAITASVQELVIKDFMRSRYIKNNYSQVNAAGIKASIVNHVLHQLLIIPMVLCMLVSWSDRYHLLAKKVEK